MTFLTPDDAVSCRRLRGQGAPDLAELDLEHLLGAGEWRYAPAPASQSRARACPGSAGAGPPSGIAVPGSPPGPGGLAVFWMRLGPTAAGAGRMPRP